MKAVGSGDDRQAIAWLVRTDSLNEKGMLRRDVAAVPAPVGIPGLRDGSYWITAWNTVGGFTVGEQVGEATGNWLRFEVPVHGDLVLAVAPA